MRIAAVLVLGLLLSAGALRADLWYVHYEKAEQALADEKWRKAVEELRQAIERKSDSGARVRTYGMKVVDYFPYLKLGIAYHHLGQESAALEAFDTEERLGVIQSVPKARRDLERYRQLAIDAQRQTAASSAATARRRTEEIVEKSLTEARRLEGEGRFQDAQNALGPGLAAEPENRELKDLMASLGAKAVAQEQRQREARALGESLEKARTLLAQGDPEQAAGLLRTLLAAGPNDEAQRLLDRAQAEIVAAAAPQHGNNQGANQRSRQIADALDAARQLQAAGKTAEALERLETVFALDPGNGAAHELRERLLAAQKTSAQDTLIQDTLRAAGAHFAGGRFEQALSAANRVLALDRSNPQALDIVRRAYVEISQRLLETSGVKAAENIPPAIRFVDLRQDVKGERVEIVESPAFRLNGVAIDSSPVTIELLADGRRVEGTSVTQAVGETFITEFSARHRLKAGATAWTVVATDSAGLSSQSQYAVFYERPWFLSPWLFAASAGSLGLGITGLVLFQRRKQRLRRERKFNPYIAGGPIFDESLFYGREPLIQRILQTVHNNSLLLHGERRIGKTSLLHQLQRRIEALDDPTYQFHPVYIDLQGTPEERFFATLADPIFEALQPLLEEFGREPALARAAYSHHDLVRELHGWIRQLKERTPKQIKLVLLIDEVDELNDYDPRVSQNLRSLFMKRFAENLAAVVAGVRIRKEWEKETSPWYNFFEEIQVDAIPPEEAARLIAEPVRGMFRFSPRAARRIVELSGGKPFQIQRRCLALVQRLHEEGRRTITLADVEALEAEGDR